MSATSPTLIIDRAALMLVIEYAKQGHPYEVCGLIGGNEGVAFQVMPIPNASLTPDVAYDMERQAMVDAIIALQRSGLEVVAIYHSHPNGEPNPSEVDILQATWPDAIYLIVGLDNPEPPEVRAWRIRNGEVEAVELVVTE